MGKSHAQSSEKTYRAIGRFIFEFSQVEYTIRDHVGQSIGLNDKYFSDIVENYNVAVLCHVAKSVLKKSLPRYQVKKLEPLINKFLQLNATRVQVAHGLGCRSRMVERPTILHQS
jgi:hypothetical protein